MGEPVLTMELAVGRASRKSAALRTEKRLGTAAAIAGRGQATAAIATQEYS